MVSSLKLLLKFFALDISLREFLRRGDELAEEAGEINASYWLSLMPADRATSIQQDTTKPVTLD